MKFISSKFNAVVVAGLLSYGVQAQAGCSMADVAGKWGFAGEGKEMATAMPFSFIGSFVLKADGTGDGVLNRSTPVGYMPNIPMTFSNFKLDSKTCIATLTVTHSPTIVAQKAMIFTNDGKEFSFIDMTGMSIEVGKGRRL